MKTYSLSEAKARFSAVIRQVRDRARNVITGGGQPAAPIRPIASKLQSIDERFAQMEREGTLLRASGPRKPFRKIADRPGALQRFLDDRD